MITPPPHPDHLPYPHLLAPFLGKDLGLFQDSLVLLFHHLHRLFLVNDSSASASTLCIHRQSTPERIRDPDGSRRPNRRACREKPDERSVGQRILHVPGETVDEIVLTSMRFVRNHNDIPPGRKTEIRIPFLFGKEFLDRGKNNPSGGYLQQLLQMSPILRLDGSLSQDLLISGKTCERADYPGRSDQ